MAVSPLGLQGVYDKTVGETGAHMEFIKNVVTCEDGTPRMSRGGNNGTRACQLGEVLHGKYW